MRSRLAALAVMATLAGCGSSGSPEATPVAAAPPPEAVVPSPPPESADPPPEPAEAPSPPVQSPPATTDDAGAAAPEPRPGLTVLEIPEAQTAPPASRDLVAAADAERRRRGETAPATIVVDQDSLSDYADVEITVAAPAGASARRAAAATAEDSGAMAAADADDQESYWRDRVLALRTRWREAHDSIERLEGEIAALRQRFYAEDDPFYRDSQIKPAWDRALDEVRAARREIESSKTELAAALEEGRRAGAEPGWLREGIDLQPEAPDFPEGDSQQVEESGIYEPTEPEVRERRRGGGGGGR